MSDPHKIEEHLIDAPTMWGILVAAGIAARAWWTGKRRTHGHGRAIDNILKERDQDHAAVQLLTAEQVETRARVEDHHASNVSDHALIRRDLDDARSQTSREIDALHTDVRSTLELVGSLCSSRRGTPDDETS